MHISRRTVVLACAATVAVAALPVPVLQATPALPAPLVADMFYTEDEPWGAFVRGHVGKDEFDKAILHMVETNADHRDNGEEWLFEYQYVGEDEDEERIRIIAIDPEHIHMRIDYVDPNRGEQYVFCKGDDRGAIPITVVRY